MIPWWWYKKKKLLIWHTLNRLAYQSHTVISYSPLKFNKHIWFHIHCHGWVFQPLLSRCKYIFISWSYHEKVALIFEMSFAYQNTRARKCLNLPFPTQARKVMKLSKTVVWNLKLNTDSSIFYIILDICWFLMILHRNFCM